MQFSVRGHQSYDTLSSSKESSRLKNKDPEVRYWLFAWMQRAGVIFFGVQYKTSIKRLSS